MDFELVPLYVAITLCGFLLVVVMLLFIKTVEGFEHILKSMVDIKGKKVEMDASKEKHESHLEDNLLNYPETDVLYESTKKVNRLLLEEIP